MTDSVTKQQEIVEEGYCPNCGGFLCIETDEMLMSNPPKFRAKCMNLECCWLGTVYAHKNPTYHAKVRRQD